MRDSWIEQLVLDFLPQKPLKDQEMNKLSHVGYLLGLQIFNNSNGE